MTCAPRRGPTTSRTSSSDPTSWYTLQDIILETGDQQTKGIERLAADRSRQQILDIFAMMPLWETLRKLA